MVVHLQAFINIFLCVYCMCVCLICCIQSLKINLHEQCYDTDILFNSQRAQEYSQNILSHFVDSSFYQYTTIIMSIESQKKKDMHNITSLL